jgi:hypothetical protein
MTRYAPNSFDHPGNFLCGGQKASNVSGLNPRVDHQKCRGSFMSGGTDLFDRASPVDDDAVQAPPPAKSDLSDVDKTTIQADSLPPLSKPPFPRPPGIFPEGYPPNRTLSRVPTPGEPLAPPDNDPAFRIVAPLKTTTHPLKVEGTARQRSMIVSPVQLTRVEGARRQTIARMAIVSRFSDFPAVNANPPRFKAKGLQYPSGNPTGTSDFPPFADKLTELLLCGISQTK